MDLGGSQGRAMLVSTSTSRPAISPDGFLRSDANVVEPGPNIGGHRMATTYGTTHESLPTLRTEQEVLGGKHKHGIEHSVNKEYHSRRESKCPQDPLDIKPATSDPNIEKK